MIPLPWALPAVSGGFKWAVIGIALATAITSAFWYGRSWERDNWEEYQRQVDQAAAEQRARTIATITRLREDADEIATQWSAAVAAVADRYGRDARRLRADAERLRLEADRLRLSAASGAGGGADGSARDRELPRCVAPDRRADLDTLLANAELDAQRLAHCQATLRSWYERVNGEALTP